MLTLRGGVLRRWLASSSQSNEIIGKDDRETFAQLEDNDGTTHSASQSWVELKALLIFVVNISVVGCVCGLFIHLTSQSLRPSVLVGLQVGMAMFNLLWNMVAVPMLSRPMVSAEKVVLTELGLLILNNIVLPCIVTALTSPECYQVLIFMVLCYS